jgi:signal transduction histidine kinase
MGACFPALGLQRREEGLEGAGVGPAVARQAVERRAGAVGVDDVMGVGSRFWARPPLADAWPWWDS